MIPYQHMAMHSFQWILESIHSIENNAQTLWLPIMQHYKNKVRLSPVKETFIKTSVGKCSNSEKYSLNNRASIHVLLIYDGSSFHHFTGVCVGGCVCTQRKAFTFAHQRKLYANTTFFLL